MAEEFWARMDERMLGADAIFDLGVKGMLGGSGGSGARRSASRSWAWLASGYALVVIGR